MSSLSVSMSSPVREAPKDFPFSPASAPLIFYFIF
ncbi:hypothetical protein Golax_010704 [Gossypium laxum]|uniref:Uncharacterized protein n=1 Tax=Gossypium laxum TaxID=34288 RepID=A0A7J8ZI56_9ROSI|nr:hypothetical protein [Gossypium laxum]